MHPTNPLPALSNLCQRRKTTQYSLPLLLLPAAAAAAAAAAAVGTSTSTPAAAAAGGEPALRRLGAVLRVDAAAKCTPASRIAASETNSMGCRKEPMAAACSLTQCACAVGSSRALSVLFVSTCLPGSPSACLRWAAAPMVHTRTDGKHSVGRMTALSCDAVNCNDDHTGSSAPAV